MPYYDPVEYFLYIPKFIEIVFFMWAGISVYRKRKYIVNRLFGISLMIWCIYTVSDLIIWTHGADSEFMLAVVNTVRDIQVSAAFLFAYLIYLTAQIIEYSGKGLNRMKLGIIAGAYAVLDVVMMMRESIYIRDPAGNVLPPETWESAPMVIVATDLDMFFGMLMLLPLILYIMSIRTLSRTARKSDDPEVKGKMRDLIIGIALLPTGLIYFAVILGLGIVTGTLFWFTLGRLIWITATVFIWKSQH